MSSDRMQKIEGLVRALEQGGDPETKRRAQELMRLVLEVHGEGLGRVVAALRALPGGDEAAADLARDPLVGHVLLLHGLHPSPAAERVAAALEPLGLGAWLVGVADGVARIRLRDLDGPAGRAAKARVEEAVWAAAPDLQGVVVEPERRLPVVEAAPVVEATP